MSKFKVGDVVRRIESPDYSDDGKMHINGVYTVIGLFKDRHIIVNDSDHKWLSNMFELIQQEQIIELI